MAGSQEIERKFWIEQLPEEYFQLPYAEIVQGYLSLDPNGKEIRLRQKDQSYWLTIKSKGTLKRLELETALSKQQFDTLWPAVEERKIVKRRYSLEKDDLLIEIDVYNFPLKGLIVAEVEFDTEEAASSYVPDTWMSKEITHLNFMKNKNLLQFDDFEQIKQLL